MEQSKANINTVVQRVHVYTSAKPQDTLAAEWSHRTSAECVLRLQDLRCLENLPSSLKIRIMQTRQTQSHPPPSLPHAWPCCFPWASVFPAAPEVSSTMKDTPPVQGSKLTACEFLVSGYFLLRRNVPLVSTPMLQAFTPLLAPPPHTERVSGTRWPTFGVCAADNFFLSSSNSNPLFSLGSFTYSLHTSTYLASQYLPLHCV